MVPRRNVAQMVRQAAYQEALRRWSGYPVLRLLGLLIVTEGYRSAAALEQVCAANEGGRCASAFAPEGFPATGRGLRTGRILRCRVETSGPGGPLVLVNLL